MRIYIDMNNHLDSTLLTIVTVFGYVLFVITFQALVGAFTLLAAATTALWNVYKFIMDRRDRKRTSQNGSGKVANIENIKKHENE